MNFFKTLAAYYTTNTLFHGFVTGVGYALLTYVVSYTGGFPTNKAALSALAFGAGGAVWGFVRGFIISSILPPTASLKASLKLK